MNLINKLKCALNSKESIRSFYHRQSDAYLRNRKSTLWRTYAVTSISWITAMIMILFFTGTKVEILIMYVGVVNMLLITNYLDYKNKKKLIEDILNQREA